MLSHKTMWHVYIIEGRDGRLYTGITNDIDRRLEEHNSGKGAKFTRGRGPFELKYTENVRTRSRALTREASIKRLSRKEKLSLLLSA